MRSIVEILASSRGVLRAVTSPTKFSKAVNPGEFGLVQLLLGHKSAETTKRFYLALETTMASEIYTDILQQNVVASQEESPDVRRAV
jgi:hypothetical protein